MKYYVSLAGRTVEVEVDGDRVSVGGRTLSASLSPVPGTPLRQLLVDGRSVALAVDPAGGGLWSLTRRGERWEAEVVDERTRHIRSLTGGGEGTRGPAVLRAPMPGLVVRVLVEAGQAVVAGGGLVVLEAMKMENELRAAGPGIVRAVHVRAGGTVEKGQMLVELEPA
ncbi:MAG TPA: biotin/lipoyl-containing protein [Gemmatimonadales bacterium]|nr:biotin/lipoyl-containing protein [Gemmatimonadales bacterium]